LPAEATPGKRTAADNQTVRTVFVIGPDKKIKLVLYYPMTTGRNFDEVLRVLDSIQLTAKYRVATPANWKQGQDVIIAGSVSDDEAKKLFPQGWKSPKPYLRITQQPKEAASGAGPPFARGPARALQTCARTRPVLSVEDVERVHHDEVTVVRRNLDPQGVRTRGQAILAEDRALEALDREASGVLQGLIHID